MGGNLTTQGIQPRAIEKAIENLKKEQVPKKYRKKQRPGISRYPHLAMHCRIEKSHSGLKWLFWLDS